MRRFQLINVEIWNGVNYEKQQVIVDTFQNSRGFDPIIGKYYTKQGFVRCKGKQFIGDFGMMPVWGGCLSDIYYSRVAYFNGEWSHDHKRNFQGNFYYVTKYSGTGKLFKALENFAKENNIN